MNFQGLLQPVNFKRRKEDVDKVPDPLLVLSRSNRRLAALKEAAEILAVLPAKGEALHALMTGRYDLSDLLQVVLGRLGKARHIRIATLSFNKHNVQVLQSWLAAGTVKRLSVLCSLFFQEHNPETFAELKEVFGSKHRLTAKRCHCKVCCLDFADGTKLVLEGSANLCTNSNREQFCLINDPILHNWHARWIDEEINGQKVPKNDTNQSAQQG